MPQYRVLFLDSTDAVRRTIEMVCDDEGAALERLARLKHTEAMELWEGARLVARVAPGEPG